MLKVSNTGRINARLSRWDRWFPAAFFFCVMALYMTLLLDGPFVDELDVFFGGYNLLKSGDLYRAYPSQHMPFSYYIAAVGALLGARTMWWFRMYFYTLLSALWTGMYIRYRKHFPRLALICMPVIYIFQLRLHSVGTTMISDHWQGIGLIIVLLELIRYTETKKITAGAAGMISLGISLSFGTTFLSAYPLAAVFLGVVAIQAVLLIRGEKKVKELLAEDGRLVLICLLPFALLALWYLISGNMGNAIGSAYDLNVNIYSKYLNGFGTEPGGTLVGTFPNWFRYQVKGINYLRSGDYRWALQIFEQTAALLIFVFSLWRNKKRIAGITFLLAVILTGVRAFDGFHGAPYMAVTTIPMAFCLDGALSWFLEKKRWARAVPAAVSMACALILVVPEVNPTVPWYYLRETLGKQEYYKTNREILEVLAEPGERIHTGDLSESAAMVMRNELRLDEGAPAVSNPWFYEFYGERELAALKANRTRIVFLDPDGSIWGHKVRDYAADFVNYVEENYTLIAPSVYVLNDDYAETAAKMREAGYGAKTVPIPGKEQEMGQMIEEGEVLEQRYIATDRHMTAVQLKAATYIGKNKAGLTVQLIDNETGETVGECVQPREQIRDGLFTRFALRAETEPGKSYTVRVTTDGTTPEGKNTGLHLFYFTDVKADRETFGLRNGEEQDYNWVIRMEYDPEE